MLGHDCAEFQVNRFRLHGEIGDLDTSESDVYKRNILTCKVDLRTERITN